MAQDIFQDTLDVTISKRKKLLAPDIRHLHLPAVIYDTENIVTIYDGNLESRTSNEDERTSLQAEGSSSNLSQETICNW